MSKSKKTSIFLILIGIIISGFFPFELSSHEQNPDLLQKVEIADNSLLISQKNSLLPISELPQIKVVKRIKVVVTAYSSSLWETDGDPHLTAAGTKVRDGIVANNLLPFGTKIRIPEIFGDQIFVVEDRMSWKKGYYHIDIWRSSHQEALNFGAKRTHIEILES